MIIWGSRGLDLKGPAGRFFCPDCNDDRDYQRRKVQRFFTLYFIPLIPLEVVHESVGCLTCKQQFTTAVLHYDPRAEREQINQELNQHFRTVLGHFGRMSAGSREQVLQQIVRAMAAFDETAFSTDEARTELERTDRNYGVASRLLAQHLTERGRELVVQQALDLATVDGVLSEGKRSALSELATTLGMSETHLRGVLA
jgi:hypothetical protein